ncbi:transcriptional regulator ATRX homolog isoform X2 [Vanessa atalanta]|uniref:transcriptional regulator ATRX homolog isoform X2 n=1 Tax=Vanessa atalanta TaxID=42275 RepID=UPI001FCD70C7|nr:transcriptional regulator ATRX homolog isoform X2 [Vanessa atalanta]
MADAVPVRDVLCEAMEYLSKLGSNLRVRSENLKEKRLRKEKLKNVHAVQKAASKVLLICELSKKSIENVETGVKKILTQIDASQAQIDCGGKNVEKSMISKSCVTYEHFEYESHKLKIRDKVNVQHFTSVKVVAKPMPTLLQDKYPVFHDCKLYRIRRKNQNNSKELDLHDSNNINITETTKELENGSSKLDLLRPSSREENKTLDSSIKLKNNEIKEGSEENMDTISNNSNVEASSKFRKSNKSCCDDEIKHKNDRHKKYKNIKILDSSDSDTDSMKEQKNSSGGDLSKTDNVSNESNCDESGNNLRAQSDLIPSLNDKENDKGNVPMDAEDSTKGSDLGKSKLNDGLSDKTMEQDKSIAELSGPDIIMQDIIESSIMLRYADDSDKDCKKTNQSICAEKTKYNSDDNISVPTPVDTANIDEHSNQSNEEGNSRTSFTVTKPILESENSQGSLSDSKPFIKCVNINKLLREDKIPKINESLIEIIDSDSDKEKKSDIKRNRKSEKDKFDKNKPRSIKKVNRESVGSRKDINKKDDEEYWKQKRKEVEAFQSKNFVVNVTKLPKLTSDYLISNELKRITQNGLVVCEIPMEGENDKQSSLNPKQAKETANLRASTDINVIKNTLLHESDSDHDKRLKNALLNDSDSDKSTIDDKQPTSNTDSQKAKMTTRKHRSKTLQLTSDLRDKKADSDDIKSSLLHDSTDDSTPTKKRKIQSNDASSPPSKRKHIMESMYAKKMLLTYSSSSDTEDENLRNALKEIRDTLLKGNSSDEEKAKEKDTSSKNSSESVQCDLEQEKSQDTSENDSSAKDTNSQIDEYSEEKSNTCSEKMGRSKGNSSDSSSQNSDTQESIEKDIDGLTNLKSLNKKHRRRRSPSTDRTESSNSKTKKKMPKVPRFSEEGFLKAETSSDAASLADSDVGEEVEIAAVPLSSLNGDGLDHLAKDDLLDESDSSSSQQKSSQDNKKENESEDEDVKLKRRKANAISSDSEAGASRRKERDARLSDFEDSDDDTSETAKKSKRKKKGSDSDASAGSSVDGSKKKRRRIKNIDDSEGSGSESETEGRNKHGRKNIRKVMSKNQLEEATKKAAREEKERIARIAERQKLYNNLEFDESGKPDEVVLDKVVLDFDPETKEPLIEVDKGLVKKLKPHQANGIKFMWNACFESVKRIKKDKGSGCILAHCMGLGKTLQVVSLTHTLLTHSSLTGVNRVLVVCPLSTVLNWVNEFRIWLKHAVTDYEVDVYELSRYKQNSERAWQLQQWVGGGGVCVLGYEMFRNLSADNVKKFKKKMLRSFQEALVDPGPDLVVCDEGHLLKNEKTSLSQAMNRVKTLRRIVLTGTPLQNNLKEYYCMVQFVKPNLLGKYNEYLNRFVNPITNGQYTDSTEHDIRIMKRRSHVLHKMLDGAVQRRDYGVLAPFLPPKHEYVLFITLTEVQIKLYQHYLDNYSRRPLPGKSSGFLFPDFQSLQRIWTHPLVLKYNSERYEIMQQKKREREEEDSEGSLADFIDDDSTPDESSSEESSDSLSDMSDDSRKKNKKKKSAKKSKGKDSKITTRRGTRANPKLDDEEAGAEEEPQARAENPTEWWMALVSDDELDDLRHSHKLVLLFDILRQCEAIGDKLLVFSQSLYSLDLIEHFLGKVDEATQEARVDEKLNGHVGSWSPGVDYFRLDGSTSCENRSIWCKNFNREDNPRARLFLISTRAGGLGINLVAANRVVIFDVSWNPSHDVQSIFRVYRFGQKKPCYIYRFLAMGTMEEKIYERQVTKQAISKRVIDEQQIDRHYAENDLAELYKFEPKPPVPRELPPLPKDRLFAEMLKEHEAQIYKYHEHDSLLENKEEETLTEEERKAAWEDFENEKTRPPPAPFSAYAMHNGMVPGLLAQQQQQLAYAALAAMLRKDMPNINDNQIRDMLPLIYNANPGMFGGYDYGLMQKMSEIYKYTQPGMMNPGMMNAVMNPAGGVSGGMSLGGSSGLQYEPPWQRQQQQLRMQQMLQHQNMGAKYYAGGLGSRDPVAMALQQQRAREMMLGERSRPRGRPPGSTRVEPPAALAAPADVVNLDSD